MYCQGLEFVRDFTAYPNYEVLVVDNASTDGTVDVLRQHASSDSRIQAEYLDTNRGFPPGNNYAAEKASGEYLILLNIDMTVTSGWVERLLQHARRDPSICPVSVVAAEDVSFHHFGPGSFANMPQRGYELIFTMAGLLLLS